MEMKKESARAQWIGDEIHIVQDGEMSELFVFKENGKFILSSGEKSGVISPSLGGELGHIPWAEDEEAAKVMLASYFASWNCNFVEKVVSAQ